jgi:hypothetical protein
MVIFHVVEGGGLVRKLQVSDNYYVKSYVVSILLLH